MWNEFFCISSVREHVPSHLSSTNSRNRCRRRRARARVCSDEDVNCRTSTMGQQTATREPAGRSTQNKRRKQDDSAAQRSRKREREFHNHDSAFLLLHLGSTGSRRSLYFTKCAHPPLENLNTISLSNNRCVWCSIRQFEETGVVWFDPNGNDFRPKCT